MPTPGFKLDITGSGEVRDKDGNLVNQEENTEQENN